MKTLRLVVGAGGGLLVQEPFNRPANEPALGDGSTSAGGIQTQLESGTKKKPLNPVGNLKVGPVQAALPHICCIFTNKSMPALLTLLLISV